MRLAWEGGTEDIVSSEGFRPPFQAGVFGYPADHIATLQAEGVT